MVYLSPYRVGLIRSPWPNIDIQWCLYIGIQKKECILSKPHAKIVWGPQNQDFVGPQTLFAWDLHS